MAKPKVGSVVKADFGDGEEYALLVDTDDDKDTLVPLGAGHKLAYREEEDRDAAGTGRTWWTD